MVLRSSFLAPRLFVSTATQSPPIRDHSPIQPRPIQPSQGYSDAPPSYEEIYPSNNNNSNPAPPKIPGDNKIQLGEEGAEWESDSSIPSISSDADLSSSSDEEFEQGPDSKTPDPILTQALEFTSHPLPPSYSPRLPQPIAIPQSTPTGGAGQPFARAYTPQLATKGIEMDEFLEFIDNLNSVTAANPALQVMGLVGGALGLIPAPSAMVAGKVIKASATRGEKAVSEARGTKYLARANGEFFKDRGLRVEVVTGEALKVKLGLGRGWGLEGMGENAGERRVAALRGHVVGDLTFEVSEPNAPTSALERMIALQQSAAKAKRERREERRRGCKHHHHHHYQQQQRYQHRGVEGGERGEGSGAGMRRLEERMGRMELKRDRKMERILSRTSDRKLDRRLERLEKKHSRKVARIDRHMLREQHFDHGMDRIRAEREQRRSAEEVKKGDESLWILIDNL